MYQGQECYLLVANDSDGKPDKKWRIQLPGSTSGSCERISHATHQCPALEIDDSNPNIVVGCSVHKIKCCICQQQIEGDFTKLDDGQPICWKDFEVSTINFCKGGNGILNQSAREIPLKIVFLKQECHSSGVGGNPFNGITKNLSAPLVVDL